MATVAILGGGVAGMSAAHELIERGFTVTVYEKKPVPGGKARSIPFTGSGTDGRADLPGEHGFRFFPRFYRHLPDTMSRIPFGNGSTCAQNLVETTRIEMTQNGKPPIVTISRFPRSFEDLRVIVNAMVNSETGLSHDDAEFFIGKLWQILTSCQDRRINEYELLSWWKFIEADKRSAAYQKFFGHGITRSLVAAKADLASTRTMGDITLQMFLDIMTPGVSADRLLNAPTDDAWIDPWLAYLRERGVDYQMNCTLKSINCDGTKITSCTIEQNGVQSDVTADHYLVAVPIEVIGTMITPQLIAADEQLASLQVLKNNVSWMNGIQFYLTKDAPLDHGHAIFLDSQWALTSVSQHQFWPNFDFRAHGDGKVAGILSVDISDWTTPGINGKTAQECTREEVAREVWEQIKLSVNVAGQQPLTDEHLDSWFLDPDICAANNNQGVIDQNNEPLLVNLVDTWKLRPEASTQIPNLFLASDYVRTNTDLATMEAANEAARRAVNGIIAASGSHAAPCEIWAMHEPDVLWPWRKHDQTRFNEGLPWDGHILG